MSESVCQGSQSSLEPGFLEPRAIFNKSAPQRSNFSQSISWPQKPDVSQEQREQKDSTCNENKSLIFHNFGFGDDKHKSNKDGELCWSFTQALANTNTSHSGKQVSQAEEEQVYVHPLAKRSSSTLSTQSLEMCTEGLGSETGSSNIDEVMADLSCLSCEKQSSQGIQRSRSREYFTKKLERHGTFPPPLTLIGGSDGIQLRPHRERGRLVLTAVTFCRKSCFQAERTDGRLRLFSLSKDGCTNCDEEISQYEDDKQSEKLENENAAEEQDSREEDTDAYARDGGAESDYSEGEGVEGSGGKLDCEIESTEEFARPSRCKEEGPRNRGLQSCWEPVWVTTS